MKKATHFKFNMLSIALGLVSVSSASYAGVVTNTCSISTSCYYSSYYKGYHNLDTGKEKTERFWLLNGIDTILGNDNDDLNARLAVQHYQNIPATTSQVSVDRGYSFDLIGIVNSNFNPITNQIEDSERKASLLIPSGTTATLSKSSGYISILNMYKAEGIIEPGVVFTFEPTYEEIEGLDDRFPKSAIYIHGQDTKLDTSADIVVNAKDTEALHISGGAQLIAKNHTITLNAISAEGVVVYDHTQATLDNVTISGDKEDQIGGWVEGNDSSISFNNGRVSLTSPDINAAFSTASGKVELNNSQVNASYAILSDAFGYPDNRNYSANQSVINITNSNVSGRTLFVAVESENDEGLPVAADYNTTVNVHNSQISGGIANVVFKDEYDKAAINLDTDTKVFLTMKDSHWTVNQDSQLDTLAMSNSTVSLQPTSAFQTLTITNDLIGNGHFDLNTDLANQKADKIVVKGSDSGIFTLGIHDSKNEPNAANGRVTLVETLTGEAQFSLKNRDYVDAGAYRYRLNKEGTNWVLANYQMEPSSPTVPDSQPVVEPTTPVKPVDPVSPPTAVQPTTLIPTAESTHSRLVNLSEMSNGLVSLRQAQGILLAQNLQGIHQRLGELKTEHSSNVWVKNQNGRIKAKSQFVAADSRSSGFNQDYHHLQIGADRAVNDNLRLGGFIGTSQADIDFNGEYHKGKLHSQAVGLYGTLANASGWYSDNVVKYERLKSTTSGMDSRRYNAFTFSTELGKRIELSNLWTMTPQAQFAYTTVEGKYDEDRLSFFTARAGMRVSKGFNLNNGWNIMPYSEVNVITEKNNDSHVRVNQYAFDVAENKERVQTALGVTAGNSSHRLGLEINQTYGSQIKQPWAVQANYRYQW